MFQAIQPVTLISSLKSLKYRLWDEDRHMLVGWEALKKTYAADFVLEGEGVTHEDLIS